MSYNLSYEIIDYSLSDSELFFFELFLSLCVFKVKSVWLFWLFFVSLFVCLLLLLL